MDMKNDFALEKEIEKAIKEGPTFGQSTFQSLNFNIAKHGTDGRSYRQILLELNQKYIALRKCRIGTKRVNAQIALLEDKISKQQNEQEKIILECDLEEKILDLETQEKLVMDAIRECDALYAIFKQLKPVTAEEFEKEEGMYWEKRLMLDAELSVMATGRIDSGTAMSLVNLGKNPLLIQTQIAVQQQATSFLIAEDTKKLLIDNKEKKDA